MKKPEIGIPGAFRESAKRFSELRKKKPTRSDTLKIIEQAQRRKESNRPKRSAQSRDLES